MTKRGEIKKATNKLIDGCYTKGSPDYPKLLIFQRQKFLNELFPLLDRLGVVIKVDRELPLVSEADVDEWCVATTNGIKVGQRFLIEAGYVAVEPLIGGKE